VLLYGVMSRKTIKRFRCFKFSYRTYRMDVILLCYTTLEIKDLHFYLKQITRTLNTSLKFNYWSVQAFMSTIQLYNVSSICTKSVTRCQFLFLFIFLIKMKHLDIFNCAFIHAQNVIHCVPTHI